ncbi:Replication factor C, subunit RFC4 [Ophidiomyces ophidiicola]|uniref:Replication factor C, subunit RFC4 n=1 Tax=Ophidiomyces ophidiicola TaxID=1387563 RepID=A0ACB8V602_9EURO|nr:Replication factor C, subunit RFC4 [Ophidiomyces ophidiicola]KAI1915949.1 Replication factor C, subunit RFC4 [Ophidiomyces ophidiicola]KAI1923060.1 Replication factor C, subunit RFC4 [Ophidiomyces ophidiicola]KAI1930622.1 Replication factor C, subunit RFC4 [Ophidiomyces ophidiicola]KAI1950791.1 Replication factor C, subunit RFC4 [Ophidiomyces ophidiicola]KAI1953895.1 Replication factor C, subunit RFC4 [Ophidiomyces ophidiicola]
MKILTKEQEDAHYNAVLKGGSVGGVLGLAAGYAGVALASRRWATIRNLTLPMKAFLVTSAGSFAAVIAADISSRDFDFSLHQEKRLVEERRARIRHEEWSRMTTMERVMDFARREKYKIIGVTWLASMVGSFVLVGRNPYLSGQQKLVQARVYAQGLTLAVLCASAAFEISDQRKGQGVLDALKAKKARENINEQHASEDLWKDMVDAEEERMKHKQDKSVKARH